MPEKEVYKLQISVEVDKDKGQAQIQELGKVLEQQGFKVKEINSQIIKSEQEKVGILGQIKTSYIAYAATIFQAYKIIKDGLAQALEEIRVKRELNNIINNLGLSHKLTTEEIEKFVKALRQGTGFTKDELLRTYTDFLRLTNDNAKSQYLLKIAMDVAAGSGRELNEVFSIFKMALASGRDASLILARALSDQSLSGKSTAEVFDLLAQKYKDASKKVTDFEKNQAKFKETLNETKETIGGKLLPIFSSFFSFVNKSFNIVVALAEALSIRISQLYSTISNAIKFNFSQIKKDWETSNKEIERIWKETAEKNKSISQNLAKDEIKIQKAKIDGIKDLSQESVIKRKEFEEQLAKEILSIDKQSFEKRKQLIEQEYQAKLSKAKELGVDIIKVEEWKQAKLNELEKERKDEMFKFEEELWKMRYEKSKSEIGKTIEMLKQQYKEDIKNFEERAKRIRLSQEEMEIWLRERNEKLTRDLIRENEKVYLKWGENADRIKSISENLYNSLSGVFNNFFQNIIKGGKDMENAFENIFNNILNAFINMLTQMAAEYLAKKMIFSLFGFSVGGGLLGILQGGAEEVPKTGPYLLHKGERVISPYGYGSQEFSKQSSQEIHLHINTFDIRQIDRVHIEKIARTLAPYLRGKV